MLINVGRMDNRRIGLFGAFLTARLLHSGAVAPCVTLEGGPRLPLRQLTLYGLRVDATHLDVQCDGLNEAELASVVADAIERFACQAYDADGYSLGKDKGPCKLRANEEEDDGE